MYYILSPIKIEELEKINIPVKDKYNNVDLDLFYKGVQGQEFLKLDPFKMGRFTNKQAMIYEINSFLCIGVVVYNCPLYVYVMTDNWYYKNLNGFHCVIFSHLYKLTNYQRGIHNFGFLDARTNELRIPDNEMYYKGNFELLESDVDKMLSMINLKEQPLWSFYIDKNEKFRRI